MLSSWLSTITGPGAGAWDGVGVGDEELVTGGRDPRAGEGRGD